MKANEGVGQSGGLQDKMKRGSTGWRVTLNGKEWKTAEI